MIIKGLLSVVVSLLTALFSIFPSVPAFPADVTSVLDSVKSYVVSGMGILLSFCYADVVIVMLDISITLFVAYEVYTFVMWVVRKIPMLGVR